MSTGEYKCENCKMEFTAPGVCSPETPPQAKCPLCGSPDVRDLTESERLQKMVLGFRRGG